MTTSFATSKDGVRIAYDCTGQGPAIVLLHGGGQTRVVWHDLGYVARLRDRFTVITIDIRGNGESDKPTDIPAYAIDRLTADILAVADSAGAAQFSVWGYSYGGNVGRYLPTWSDRVSRLAIVGIPFGAAAPHPFRSYALGLRAKWTPIIEAARLGTLDLDTLAAPERARWQTGTIPLIIAQLSAMMEWPPVEPDDLRCPTLWVVGGDDQTAMPSVDGYREQLAGTKVVLQLLQGLTHGDELAKIDVVLPPLLAFTAASVA
jgi:pimeloyl-ACP methyl ester carboxylesterase